ncbi:hypothetical protein [Nocardia sp. XZ_19_369]|uniref:hypothetical protein n=1 Tax=Nocardia sp. XZ_19_369 TaxID=2769487 RepID=UPI00188F39A2|nr:hypothetical protein [Nocardia sp. XZ_19_369]
MSYIYDDERPQEFTLDKFGALTRHAYGVIAKILAALPIPITVTPLPIADPNAALDEFASARRAMRDMPVGAAIGDAVVAVLLGWLTAVTIAAVEPDDDGSDDWILEAAYYQMMAVELRAHLALDMVTSI